MDTRTDTGQTAEQDGVALQPINTLARNQTASPSRSARSANARLRRPTIEDRRQPSIRLRRLASSSNLRAEAPVIKDFANASSENASGSGSGGGAGGNRRRSSSEPQRMQWNPPPSAGGNNVSRTRGRGISTPMAPLDEEAARDANLHPYAIDGDVPHELARRPGLRTRASTAARSALGLNAMSNYNERRRDADQETSDEYETRLVDFLDVVDPEIATLSTLTNVQNSLFIPHLGTLLNRRPTYTFTRDPTFVPEIPDVSTPIDQTPTDDDGERPPMSRSVTITSNLPEEEDHYAVLPHGINLKGWTPAEKEELNDHVRHLLHSKRAAFKRSMKGFFQYVRRPLGFFVTLYAFLITGFGLIWVLFLIGWISAGEKQKYDINVIDNVLVALFAIMGDGLAPFRAVDTYHMIFIAHYHHLTWDLRKKRNLPELEDHNDLPGLQPKADEDVDIEAEAEVETASVDGKDLDPDSAQEIVVLTPKQQLKLKHHQDKFSKSHTFYKPHETTTHHAFPLRLLVAIVVLCDFHSIFQIALGTCTWAINYHHRPEALTTVILCFSLTCNITAGILISVGDKRTRKKEVVERMFRQQLTEQAMHKIEKRRKREQERNETLEATVTPDPILRDAPTPEPMTPEPMSRDPSSPDLGKPHPDPMTVGL